MENTCVVCGAIIPEGRQVCPNCMEEFVSKQKDECAKDFAERRLEMSDEKCNQCEYLYLCPYMAKEMDDIVNGDDGF